MTYVIHNGTIVPAKDPLFTIGNRAFRYGDALFETIRLIDGSPIFLEDHLHRMGNSMKILKMDGELPYAKIQHAFSELSRANGVEQGGRARLTVYRTSGGYYTPLHNTCEYTLEIEPLVNNPFVINEQGYRIDIYSEHRKAINPLSAIKSTNCITYVLAGVFKRDMGLDECILLNERGSMAEAVSSNVFIALNGVIYTPNIDQAIVPGIMRDKVIKLAKEMGTDVQECTLSPEVLINADEILLTNAINGITWVGAYKRKRYYNNLSRKLVDKLNKHVASSRMDLQGN